MEKQDHEDKLTKPRKKQSGKSKSAAARPNEPRPELEIEVEVELELEQNQEQASLKEEQPSLAEQLKQWSEGIASCWQIYMAGGQAELERVLPGYMERLSKPTLTPGPDQKMAAALTAQVYQLNALLDLQRGDFASAQANGTQALVYSQLATAWNIYIASQLRLVNILSTRKRVRA